MKRVFVFLVMLFVIILGACGGDDQKSRQNESEIKAVEKTGFSDADKTKDKTADGADESDLDETEEMVDEDDPAETEGTESADELEEDGLRSGEQLQSASGQLTEAEVRKLMIYVAESVYFLGLEESESRRDEIYSTDMEKRDEAIKEGAKSLVKPFSEFIVSERAGEMAADFMERLNCECDWELPFEIWDLHAGFKLIEFNKDSFIVESMDVDNQLYGDGLIFEWEFKREDGKWKFANRKAFGLEQLGDLKLTFEDLENAFFDIDFSQGKYEEELIPVEFVEYFEENGVRYLVVYFPASRYMDEHYRIYDTQTTLSESVDTYEKKN